MIAYRIFALLLIFASIAWGHKLDAYDFRNKTAVSPRTNWWIRQDDVCRLEDAPLKKQRLDESVCYPNGSQESISRALQGVCSGEEMFGYGWGPLGAYRRKSSRTNGVVLTSSLGEEGTCPAEGCGGYDDDGEDEDVCRVDEWLGGGFLPFNGLAYTDQETTLNVTDLQLYHAGEDKTDVDEDTCPAPRNSSLPATFLVPFGPPREDLVVDWEQSIKKKEKSKGLPQLWMGKCAVVESNEGRPDEEVVPGWAEDGEEEVTRRLEGLRRPLEGTFLFRGRLLALIREANITAAPQLHTTNSVKEAIEDLKEALGDDLPGKN